MTKGYVKNTKPEYYKVSSLPSGPKDYRIVKFDHELDATSVYTMELKTAANGEYHDCSCPAAKFDCRHKGILADILAKGGLNLAEFYCHQAPADRPDLQGTFVAAGDL